ncbi:1-deoxy-D-xylulose-5-phosphate synthase [Alicyclobacillus ferrooxydans]|uniref:1-deoxy-D-xylulose-5-phosphate synthase n=1 Tax=Alicyclobacillus ferrooxydans TaxID=471514 RepID=A0A0P9CCK1_9BACL|nr:1-deoxy-D-xylulose-5-phosphate synthase [Alicyclobacillus ferrooxydans]KPV43262.1 1-deoxy-D-xylulose-5-phosphate synthase [Alicyclobacillus ferrooxydans]
MELSWADGSFEGCCFTLLEHIRSPKDLKRLNESQLVDLAAEVREFLVESVSKTGGHFGANLGVVELTLALHKVFDSPRDKIVWDVGHQAYVHKMLTGRMDKFSTLRKFKGLAGFPKRNESPHDAFGVGHASTSISAGLGMAVARDLAGQHYKVVSVIGDGALTGGMAMEALNHAGEVGTDFLVILNDNEMSIAENVGALSQYLTRLRSDPTYSRAKAEIENAMRRVPGIGRTLTRTLERLKDSMRHMFVPGLLFEGFGFKYLGPVDGHDLPSLLKMLEDAKNLRGPVLLHMVTQKGKGYASAEEAPDKWHAWPSSAKKNSPPSYSKVFGDTMMELAEADPRVVAVTPAMVPGSGLTKFRERFPNRIYDVGIAEQHAATFCAGLAAAGRKPVLAIYSTFLQRAYDQVIHDICIQQLPVVIAIDRAGIVGPDGETHQGAFDMAYLRTIPNLTLMMPKDEGELRHMMFTALQQQGPVAVRYPRADGAGANVEEPLHEIPIGKSELLREGDDLCIMAVGPMVGVALQAAERLAQQGLSASIINARYIKPLDKETIIRYAKVMPLMTIEEGALAGGFGSAVAELLMDEGIQTELARKGFPDHFIEHGTRAEVLSEIGLDVDHVVDAATKLCGHKDARQSPSVRAWS